VRELGDPGFLACIDDPPVVDGVDVVGVDEAAARRPLAEYLPGEMELAAVELDDQVVPFLVRRTLLLKPRRP